MSAVFSCIFTSLLKYSSGLIVSRGLSPSDMLREAFYTFAVLYLILAEIGAFSKWPSTVPVNRFILNKVPVVGRQSQAHFRKANLHLNCKSASKDVSGLSYSNSLIDDVYRVAVPAMAACIVEPALSLVDTYFVGKSKPALYATLGLAGMSVNGALFNVIAAATSPLGTGTTAVISKIRGVEEQKSNNTETETTKGDNSVVESTGSTFLNGMALSASIGAMLSSVLLLFGRGFLRNTFDITQPEFLKTTTEYLKIRGLSLPSVLLNYIIFGYSIAMQDVLAPILSIVTAFWVNVIGDYVLVGRFNKGLAGAAIATTLSSYLGTLLALRHLFRKFSIKLPRKADSNNISDDSSNNTGDSGSISTTRSSSSSNSNSGIAWGRLFDKKGLKLFFSASLPLFAGAVANTFTYSAGARVSSITTSPTAVATQIAAHQIVMQSWWLLSFFSSPFSLVAQAVLPKDLAADRKHRVRDMILLLSKFALLVAVATTIVNISMLKYAPALFTNNIEVQALLQQLIPQSGVSLFLICLATVIEGVFIGCGRLGDYVKASVLSTAAAWLYYTSVSMKKKMGVVGTWNGLLIFSITRLMYFLFWFPRVWKSTRPTVDSPQ